MEKDNSGADLSRHYSDDEVMALISALSVEEQRRLAMLARNRAQTLPGVEAGMLLNEAVVRTIDGRRNWPRGVSADRFLDQTMRSIVSNDWKHLSVESKYGVISEQQAKKGCEEYSGIPDEITDSVPDPARIIYVEQRLEQVFKALASDHNAIAVAMGRAEQKTQREIQETFGLTARDYESARKRFDRVMAKMFSEGADI